LSITLGSLLDEDIRALQELELLPEAVDPAEIESIHTAGNISAGDTDVATTNPSAAVQHSVRSGRLGNLNWFEEMIDGSRLGRTQTTRRGAGISADGTTQVSWEISEYIEGEDDGQPTTKSKRKHGDVDVDEHVSMKQQ
jgi:hypothetical protein